MIYLVNAISPAMFTLPIEVAIYEASVEEAKAVLSGGFTCAIGHPGTAALAARLLGIDPQRCQRLQLSGLSRGDQLIVLTLRFRPPEGRVYDEDELLALLHQGQIALYLVTAL